MMNTFGKILTGAAAASLLAVQPAAAATRSANAIPAVSAEIGADRLASPVRKGESEEVGTLVGVGGAWFIVTAIVIVAGIIIAVELDDADSPG